MVLSDSDRRLIETLQDGFPLVSRPYAVLAERAGMSRSAFADRFSEGFGKGPMEFLRDIRLNHAARLLEQTGLPTASIAGRVGFESRSYFSRAFKARYGEPPETYRRKERHG